MITRVKGFGLTLEFKQFQVLVFRHRLCLSHCKRKQGGVVSVEQHPINTGFFWDANSKGIWFEVGRESYLGFTGISLQLPIRRLKNYCETGLMVRILRNYVAE
jgi:hypothetical protein